MSFVRRAGVLACALSLSVSALMAAPRLVPIADQFRVVPVSSSPNAFRRIGSYAYFLANDAIHGIAFWRTDGTTAGTSLFFDPPASADASTPAIVGSIGNAVLISQYDNGWHLWRTDGTAAGTWSLDGAIQPLPGPSSRNYELQFVAADTLLYVLVQTNSNDVTINVTDGTPAGTRQAGRFPLQLRPAPVGRNGKLYFNGYDMTVGTRLWTSDGTLDGTHMIRQSVECPGSTCGPAATSLHVVDGRVCFLTDDGLWTTDGTGPGTVKLADGSYPSVFASGPAALWIRSTNSFIRTNGTAAGTSAIADPPWANSAIYNTVLDDGRLVVVSGANNIPSDIWNGTTRVGAAPPLWPTGQSPSDAILGSLGSRVFLSVRTDAIGTELWIADVDARVIGLLKDLDPRADLDSPYWGSPGFGVALGGKFLFSGNGVAGRELWGTDGTPDGTSVVANIAADPGGGNVSGTVRDATSGAPLPHALVSLCLGGCDLARTDSNGNYRFEGIAPNTYSMSATQVISHLRQNYPGTITVSAGVETAGVDFSLTRGGRIAGTVVRASTTQPLFLEVLFRNASGTVVGQTLSNQQTGAYRSPALPTGSYFVETRASGWVMPPAVDQIFRNLDCAAAGCSRTSAETVTVTLGNDTTGIDFALHDYGTISGTVRDASGGLPAPGMPVQFTRTDNPSSFATATTDAQGQYLSPLLGPGSYIVSVNSAFGYNRAERGSPVTVSADGATTGIDVQVTQTAARINGIVRDADGQPLNGILLELLDADGNAFNGNIHGMPQTDANGLFALYDLPAGTYYLRAQQELYSTGQLCPALPCNTGGATAITVTAGQTRSVEWNLTVRRISVRGRILDSVTGQPVPIFAAQLTFSISFASGSTRMPVPAYYASGYDQFAGEYVLSTLTREPSLYVVAARVNGRDPAAYPDVRMNCELSPTCLAPANATLIPVGTHTGKDIRVVRRGTLGGTVYDAAGQPLQGVTVSLRTSTNQAFGSATTLAGGIYRFSLPAGSYYVVVTQSGFTPQSYPGQTCSSASCNPPNGQLVTVADSTDANGIDFRLDRTTGRIAGRVVDDVTGAAMANVSVRVNGPGGNFSALTDANGNYTLGPGLTSGQYSISAEGPGPYYIALGGGVHCPSFSCPGAAPVTVNAPNTTMADFRLIRVQLTSISPATGPTSGGTTVVLRGANFAADSTVSIGGVAATVVSVSPTQITAVTGAGARGVAHVVVSHAFPRITVVLTHGFTYGDPVARRVVSDFDGNGKSDLLWKNRTSGLMAQWNLDGRRLVNGATFATVDDTNWRVQGIADFNGDGKADVLWRHATSGHVAMWEMNGRSVLNGGLMAHIADLNWQIQAIGDFDANGRSEIVWRHLVSGEIAMWEVDGHTLVNGAVIATIADQNWQIVSAVDFTGDGRSELLWRNRATGQLALWEMNGRTFIATGLLSATPDDLQWAIHATGDFNGDGKTDLVWRHPATGQIAMWEMDGRAIMDGGVILTITDTNWQIEGAIDADGNGRSELIWRHQTAGDVAMWELSGHTLVNGAVFASGIDTTWEIQP